MFKIDPCISNIFKPKSVDPNLILSRIKNLPEVEEAKGTFLIKISGMKTKKMTFTYQSGGNIKNV